MLSREKAIEMVREKVSNENLVRHMIGVGVIMRDLALHLNEPVQRWELAGILHDIDLGQTDDMSIHGNLGASWLEEMGFDQEFCDAVRAHAGHVQADSQMAKALFAVDQLSGLIVACALVKGKKLGNVTPSTVMKRFKEKRFAAGANRESILTCESIGLNLAAFVELALPAMQSIAGEIDL